MTVTAYNKWVKKFTKANGRPPVAGEWQQSPDYKPPKSQRAEGQPKKSRSKSTGSGATKFGSGKAHPGAGAVITSINNVAKSFNRLKLAPPIKVVWKSVA